MLPDMQNLFIQKYHLPIQLKQGQHHPTENKLVKGKRKSQHLNFKDSPQ